MAVTASYDKFFTGRVIQREYTQEFDFEFIPNYTVVTRDGVEVERYISSYTRNFVTAKVVEQTFRFLGMSRSLAFGTGAITVADLDGNEYTFTPKTSVTDGSSGSRVMIVEEVDVQRIPTSPHMWELVVTRRGYRYYVNGSHISLSGEPAWMINYV